MKKLYIIGAGGFGREVLGWAIQSAAFKKEWVIGGFLDDGRVPGESIHGVKVLSSVEDHKVSDDDLFICAIGDPQIKRKVCEVIIDKGGMFTNIIHPSVTMGQNVKLGTGIILCANVVLTCDLVIEDFVAINNTSNVGHDAIVGKWSTISPHCDVTGGVVLEEGVFLGSNVTILPKVKVGKYATVGAGSVVIKNVKPHTTVFGIPARIISI